MNSTNLNGEMKKAEAFGKARIRRFKKEDKLRILAEADQVQGTGKIHEILRREGIYSSQLSDWRRKRANGEFGSGADSTELGKKKASKGKCRQGGSSTSSESGSAGRRTPANQVDH